jgi:hypothetical protein
MRLLKRSVVEDNVEQALPSIGKEKVNSAAGDPS